MRNPRFGTLMRASLVLLVTLGVFVEAVAQKKPQILDSTAAFSPNNKHYYSELARSYKTHLDNGELPEALLVRNRLVFVAVEQIDLNFYEFQKGTRKKRALLQTLLDILEIGAKSAIAITNGERAKTLIAEGLGFLQLSRTAANNNYSLRETQILFNKMVAKRSDVLANIMTNSVKTIEEYPLEFAFIEVIGYYKAGTLDGAMENLSIDTGAEANQSTRNLEQIKIATPEQLESSIVLRATLADLFTKLESDDATVRRSASDRLKAGLKAVPELLDDLPPDAVDHLRDDELDAVYRQMRQKLVRDRPAIQKVIDAVKQ
jgi:hypothetical protein